MRTIQTSLGLVPLWGDFDRFDAGRPLVVAIRGAFARVDHYLGLALDLPEVDIAFLHLPGMHSPHVPEPSVEAFARAHDEAVVAAFPGRPFVKVGLSIGALVAMAMCSGEATLALDPPVSTEGLWPLRSAIIAQARRSPAMRAWCWGVFGEDGERSESRNYRPLVLTAKRPLTIMIAGDHLEPEREVKITPGLISGTDRAWLRTVPGIQRVWVEGAGHNIALAGAGQTIMDYIRRMVVEPA